jgi:hypothetical protein
MVFARSSGIKAWISTNRARIEPQSTTKLSNDDSSRRDISSSVFLTVSSRGAKSLACGFFLYLIKVILDIKREQIS